MEQTKRKRRITMGIFSVLTGLLFAGCGKEPISGYTGESVTIGEPVEVSVIDEISFYEHESYVPEISGFTIKRSSEGCEVRLDIGNLDEEYVHPEDEAVLDAVQELLQEYQVGEWNGFKGNNQHVLDGGGFGLTVTFTDGTVLTASGSNSYPENYGAVSSALWELIEPARKSWREKAYPKEITDTQIDYFSFRVYPNTIPSQEFECFFEPRSDDPENIYLRIQIKNGLKTMNLDCEEYQFYGAVPNLPFDKLQEAVENYQLAQWNGYEEFGNYEERERTFYLSISYESGESIEASGNVLPENYMSVENELIRIIWDYIQENERDFEPWSG